MRTKILILGLMCLFIFAYCESPADPEIEKALNPGNPTVTSDPPVINRFEVVYVLSDSFTLYWSVTDATTISIDQGIGEVDTEGEIDVQVFETTTFTLTATNESGQVTASCVAENPEHAVLELTTNPPIPLFTYHPYTGVDPDPLPEWSSSYVEFIIILTETNGIGGTIWSLCLETSSEGNGCVNRKVFFTGVFEPYGEVKYLFQINVPCRPTIMTAYFEGYDNNDSKISGEAEIPFAWTN